jgi:RNA polymerase sigma-70 factor (ECF subfamily)
MGTSAPHASTGAPGGLFRPTLWTVVLRAKDPGAPDRRDALERLFQAYWKPVYFLVRRTRDTETARDLTQGFFTAFLEKDYLQYVDRGRGKFRTFLRVALDHFLADEHDRAHAQKRGGGKPALSLDFAKAETEVSREPATDEAPDRLFQRQWALEVIKRSLQALRAEFEASGRQAEFEALHHYLSAGGAQAPSHADLAQQLGLSASDVNNRVHRLKKRYRELILEEIRSYTETEEAAKEELRDLFSAFSPPPR